MLLYTHIIREFAHEYLRRQRRCRDRGAAAARPPRVDVWTSADDAARARADLEAQLADRLSRERHPAPRRLRNVRSGARERGRAARLARADPGVPQRVPPPGG